MNVRLSVYCDTCEVIGPTIANEDDRAVLFKGGYGSETIGNGTLDPSQEWAWFLSNHEHHQLTLGPSIAIG
jgi:hypothetical protein